LGPLRPKIQQFLDFYRKRGETSILGTPKGGSQEFPEIDIKSYP